MAWVGNILKKSAWPGVGELAGYSTSIEVTALE